MKAINLISALCLTMLFVVPLHAQWTLGGAIDINIASINVDPEPSSEEYSSRLGFGFGAVVDRPLSGQFDFHAEPMFLQKGGVIKEDGDEITFKVHYFEIPLMIRYTFQKDGSMVPYVMAGPSIGILMSAKIDVKNGPELDQKDDTSGMDFGLGFGGGAKFPHGNKTYFAEARYVLGMTNINSAEGESDVKNRGLQIVAGVTVPFGDR
ncbi:MAG: PorT family protein [Calditrichaeota bacterium]|nr:MAG: PorT family protein [Calditrichota bacterium]